MRVLHVGSGTSSIKSRDPGKPLEEIRLDIDPDVNPDVVGSATAIPLPDNEFDVVYSRHVIEHFYPQDFDRAMAEFLRVLKPGGQCIADCPDLQAVAHFIVADRMDDVVYSSPAGPVTVTDMLYGYTPYIRQGNLFMAHHWGFTPRSLHKRFEAAGFVDVRVEQSEGFSIRGIGIKAPERGNDAHGV